MPSRPHPCLFDMQFIDLASAEMLVRADEAFHRCSIAGLDLAGGAGANQNVVSRVGVGSGPLA